MVLSSLPLARVSPSGLKAIPRTAFACSVSVRRRRPVCTSHSLMVLSPLPLARVSPSGLKATPQTALACSVSVFGKLVMGNSLPMIELRIRVRCSEALRLFVGCKGFLVSVEAKQCLCLALIGRGIVLYTACQSILIGNEGFLISVETKQCCAFFLMVLRFLWCQLNDLLIRSQCILIVAKQEQDVALFVIEQRCSRFKADGLLIGFKRFWPTSQAQQ